MDTKRESGFSLLPILLLVAAAVCAAVWWRLNEGWQREAAAVGERAALIAQMREQQGLLAQWDDALKLADTAPRLALAGPVAKLQEIKRAVEGQTVSGCLARPTGELRSGMGTVIDGFLIFLGNDAYAGVRAAEKFDAATVVFARYQASLAECSATTGTRQR
jgi:hypothetical protein